MSHLDRLLESVPDQKLRAELQREIANATRHTSFGLVFQRHLPETVALPSLRPHRFDKVFIQDEARDTLSFESDDLWIVASFGVGSHKNIATLVRTDSEGQQQTRREKASRLTVAKEFNDPIYPGLKEVGEIVRGGDKPFHIALNSENYHALQALQYTHAYAIDAILIDPPYNTGEKDWVYNDRLIDNNDGYRHSKWLSFMERRLRIAKTLLKPDGVLAVHIDDNEVHRLGLLLHQMFPSASINMVTVQASGGKPSGGMLKMEEHIFFVFLENFQPAPVTFSAVKKANPWHSLTLSTFDASDRPNQVYPIYVDAQSRNVVGVGKSLDERIKNGEAGDAASWQFEDDECPEGAATIWPITSKGDNCIWRSIPSTFMRQWNEGFIRVVDGKNGHPNRFGIQFVNAGHVRNYKSGALQATGTLPGAPTLIFEETDNLGSNIPTIWSDKSHYTDKGGAVLRDLFGQKRFTYPKSPYLVYNMLQAMVGERPEATVLDYFAGSGTTQHAVAMLNAADGGHRTSIIVTNNQVNGKEAKKLKKAGVKPGSEDFEREGIFHAVTMPRIVYAMSGERDGLSIDGTYLPIVDDEPWLISDGFKENVRFFDLTYEDPGLVSLGRRFTAMAPLLWLKAGARGAVIKEISSEGWSLPDDSFYAVIFDPDSHGPALAAIAKRLEEDNGLEHVFVVTDSASAYRQIISQLPSDLPTTRLYEDYLRTFEINKDMDE